uniref:Uncharacterized protein n=1 Tax=Oryzias melastigma TaxID=30732 RepID=A0A3B3DFW0_ORYME
GQFWFFKSQIICIENKHQLKCKAELSLTWTLDQMGRRIKDLEKNVAELMSQAGMEASSDVMDVRETNDFGKDFDLNFLT